MKQYQKSSETSQPASPPASWALAAAVAGSLLPGCLLLSASCLLLAACCLLLAACCLLLAAGCLLLAACCFLLLARRPAKQTSSQKQASRSNTRPPASSKHIQQWAAKTNRQKQADPTAGKHNQQENPTVSSQSIGRTGLIAKLFVRMGNYIENAIYLALGTIAF